MTKPIVTVIIIMTAFTFASAQETGKLLKFKDFVFEEVRVQKNLYYKTTINPGVKKKYYSFDFYEPAADSTARRPLIIWLHGGGFKFGTKKSGGLPLWSKTFAQRGYTCAAVNYRLSKKHPLRNFADLAEGCADAVKDVNDAVEYFKQHSAAFRIDTTRIILGGNSAGGMIALQAVYSSPAEIATLIHRGDSTSREAQLHNPQHIAAIINYWGALFDPDWLNNASVPIVSVHGKKDRVIPYDNKKPGIYGSLTIHLKADALKIPNRLRIYEGHAHELQKHFNPLFAGGSARKRWRGAGQFAADFLYEKLWANK